MFTPQTYPEILARLVAHARASSDQLTDFNVGSVTRSWLESAAIGLDELWMGAVQAVDAAIPEAIYSAFGFERLPAAYALGDLTFSLSVLATEDVVIPAGTAVRVLGGTAEYLTIEAGTLAAGQYSVTVRARATTSGPDANAAAGTLTVLAGTLATTVSVTNRAPILNGHNEETDTERKARFAEWVRSLSRGTVAALDYGARLAYLTDANGVVAEQVQHVALSEVPGTVDLWVHNGVGHTSAALVERVREIIEGRRDDYTGIIQPGWRAAGVEVIYHAMADVPLTVRARVTLAGGATLASASASAQEVLAALTRTFTGDFLSVPEILNALYGATGIVDLLLEEPAAGLRYQPWERPVYGSLTLHA